MTLTEVEEKIKLTESYLDKIDIKYLAKRHHIADVYYLMRKIEWDVYPAEIKELEGTIFNYMNEDEFIDYLKRRYNDEVSCEEYIIHEVKFK